MYCVSKDLLVSFISSQPIDAFSGNSQGNHVFAATLLQLVSLEITNWQRITLITTNKRINKSSSVNAMIVLVVTEINDFQEEVKKLNREISSLQSQIRDSLERRSKLEVENLTQSENFEYNTL